MKSIFYLFAVLCLPSVLFSQNSAKKMTHEVYEIWNKIENPQISNYGNWAVYQVTNEKGDSKLYISDTRSDKEFSFDRSTKAVIDAGENFVAFRTKAHVDTVRAMKRRKVKKSKMPHDTLVIFNLKTKGIERIPNVETFKLSKEHPGSIAFKFVKRTLKQDSTLVKDEGKENGSKLIIKNVLSNESKTIPYAKAYVWSEKNGVFVVHTTGPDSIRQDKVLLYESGSHKIKPILTSEGDYTKFAFNIDGSRLAFIGNRDTTEAKDKMELITYSAQEGSAGSRVSQASGFLKPDWQVSEHHQPYFLDEGDRVVFGVAPVALEVDTTLLDEDKVELEIWNYKDGYLHTRQESRKKADTKKSYLAIYDYNSKKAVQLNDLSNPELTLSKKHVGKYVLSYDNVAYTKYESWEGHDYKDLYLVNVNTGDKNLIATQIEGRPRLSPSGNCTRGQAEQ